jgi:hypothetical protein
MNLNFKKSNLYLAYVDAVNYFDWKRTIKKEEKNPDSKYNTFGFKRNFFYDVFVVISLDEMDKALPIEGQRYNVIEKLVPVNKYIDEELGFAECIVPEFNQFFDAENTPTLSFLIGYRFTPEVLTLGWVLKWIFYFGIASLAFYLFTYFNININLK